MKRIKTKWNISMRARQKDCERPYRTWPSFSCPCCIVSWLAAVGVNCASDYCLFSRFVETLHYRHLNWGYWVADASRRKLNPQPCEIMLGSVNSVRQRRLGKGPSRVTAVLLLLFYDFEILYSRTRSSRKLCGVSQNLLTFLPSYI